MMTDLPQRLSAARSRGMREGRVGERVRRRDARLRLPRPSSRHGADPTPLLLCAALLAIYVSPPDALILGLDHDAFMRLALGTAFLLWMLLTGVRSAGPAGVARIIGSAASWALLIVSLTGVYAYRYELSDIAGRVMGEFAPAEPTVGRGGEVNVRRRLGGEYLVAAKINDKPVSLIFDTGASTVVLRAEDAAKVGINSSGLDFNVEVVTANGPALAADPTRQDVRRHDRAAQRARAGRAARRSQRKPARHELPGSTRQLHGRAW